MTGTRKMGNWVCRLPSITFPTGSRLARLRCYERGHGRVDWLWHLYHVHAGLPRGQAQAQVIEYIVDHP